MAPEANPALTFTADIREGTVSGPGGSVRLEPKVMEVLRLLASHAGRVVSKDELLDAVWPDVVVTDHTVSRCIYQLRHELARIDGKPEGVDHAVIETLPKRGYRLLANIETLPVRDAPTAAGAYFTAPVIPFVVGQWVRGDRFYGRTNQIAEILAGPRNCIWLLGTRRIGKTSLLKQIEYLADSARDRRYFPLFWDFQGASTPGELHLNFTDALLDAEERFARIGIDPREAEADDLFVSLERLRRLLRGRQLRLLLLCDEVEELIELHRNTPSLLRKLRHAMQSHEDIRTVLASTIRLWALAGQQDDTSPFLHGFTPPVYMERFADDEAQALIEQSHLPPESRPRYEDGDIKAIRTHCDNHPFLMQLVCKRYAETGALDTAIEQVATDRMVSYFFSVDFDMLSANERAVVHAIARRTACPKEAVREELSLGADALAGTLRRLEDLGFVRSNEAAELTLANYFFRRWLRNDQGGADTPESTISPVSFTDDEESRAKVVDGPSRQGLLAELKRRNVFRVGVAYIIVAWLLLQLGDILFDFLEIPQWAGKLLVVLLSLGLPVALVLAWAFELTPRGLRRDDGRNLPRS